MGFLGKEKAKQHLQNVKYREKNTTELILKPSGVAGKTPPKGYNLQEAMGLTDNKRRYNRLSVSSA
jgi:hypothetical protein